MTVQKQDGGIAVVTLASEPVNIMHLDFWNQLLAAFEALEADAEVRGVIFQSGLKRNVFTAGLDVKEFYAPGTSRQQMHTYWGALSKTMTKIYSSPMMTAAAIKGACPAGGCCLSLCCDYRVITADGSMGFNEVALGMGGVPPLWAELMTSIIGRRATERLVQTGDTPGSAELLQMGMVDAVVEKADAVLPKALEEARRWLKNGNDIGRSTSKSIMRDEFTKRWTTGLEWEVDFLWNSANLPQVVKGIGGVLSKLSGGKKQPASKL